MSRTVLKPVEQQVAEYREIFACYLELQAWTAAHPDLRAYVVKKKDGVTVTRNNPEYTAFHDGLRARGYQRQQWTWDEAWDGLLIERVRRLAAAEFEVQRFWRKQKIDFRAPKGWDRHEVLNIICMVFPTDDWAGINFKRTGMSIWWQGGGPWKSYRP